MRRDSNVDCEMRKNFSAQLSTGKGIADNQSWKCKTRIIDLSRRTLIMGIVNVTPDSFSDGGRFDQTDAAIAHGLRLVEEGADLLDIGGESTRPGAEPVLLDEELNRVLPVIRGLRAVSG